MSKIYDYDQTVKIELLNELSKGVTARLVVRTTRILINMGLKNRVQRQRKNGDEKSNFCLRFFFRF